MEQMTTQTEPPFQDRLRAGDRLTIDDVTVIVTRVHRVIEDGYVTSVQISTRPLTDAD